MTNAVLPDASSDFGRRVRDRLRDERAIWLTTVAATGTPQPNPVWFVWDEDTSTVLVYNRPDAWRLRHIASNARVALHFDGNGKGGDVVVLTGPAALAPELPRPHEHVAYLAKYRESMTRVSGSPEDFSEQYPVPLIVSVQRIRGF
jgi:PPOX class probable F420-dependent enzyme